MYGLSDRLPFGKYKGSLISTVIRQDPRYVEWLLENVADFELDWRAEQELDYELEKREEAGR